MSTLRPFRRSGSARILDARQEGGQTVCGLYTLLNLHAAWRFTGKTSLTLAVNNVLNTKYWANLDYPNYGDPRSASLTLRAKF